MWRGNKVDNLFIQLGSDLDFFYHRILDEDRLGKLDLNLAKNLGVAANNTAWSSTRLKFERIDGESSGDVHFDHLVKITALRYLISNISFASL